MADLPEYMHSFSDDAGKESTNPNKAPNCIYVDRLDDNFKACLPKKDTGPNPPYKVDATKEGWKLLPTLTLDVCENGRPGKIRVFGNRIGSVAEVVEES